MRNFFARFAYWWSLGWDMSEMHTGAAIRQQEREARLERRIGRDEIKRLDLTDSGATRDPAFWATFLPTATAIAVVGIFIVVLLTK